MKILNACWLFKTTLLKRQVEKVEGQKSKDEVYDQVAEDLTKLSGDVFPSGLKASTVKTQWLEAVKQADKQQEDKASNT